MNDDLSSLFEKFNIDKNSISPEMVNNLMSMINRSNNNSTDTQTQSDYQDHNNAQSNIDFDTILKMKNIIEKMNSKNDPRSNLLESLKPYLKESRRNKIDQYVQLMNMSRVMENFNMFNGENKNASK